MRQVIPLALLAFLLAGSSGAETREQRQQRSISVLRQGLLRHSPIARISAPAVPRRSYRESDLPTVDAWVDASVVEGFESTVYDLEGREVGSVFTATRIVVPPVTAHVSRASRIVYQDLARSPHAGNSNSSEYLRVRSWGKSRGLPSSLTKGRVPSQR